VLHEEHLPRIFLVFHTPQGGTELSDTIDPSDILVSWKEINEEFI